MLWFFFLSQNNWHDPNIHFLCLTFSPLSWVRCRDGLGQLFSPRVGFWFFYVALFIVELSWVKLSRAELSWVKLNRAESSWVELSWAESDKIGSCWPKTHPYKAKMLMLLDRARRPIKEFMAKLIITPRDIVINKSWPWIC